MITLCSNHLANQLKCTMRWNSPLTLVHHTIPVIASCWQMWRNQYQRCFQTSDLVLPEKKFQTKLGSLVFPEVSVNVFSSWIRTVFIWNHWGQYWSNEAPLPYDEGKTAGEHTLVSQSCCTEESHILTTKWQTFSRDIKRSKSYIPAKQQWLQESWCLISISFCKSSCKAYQVHYTIQENCTKLHRSPLCERTLPIITILHFRFTK